MKIKEKVLHMFAGSKVMLERYELFSDKIKPESGRIRLEVLSDYHGGSGKEQEDRIVKQLQKRFPDLILIPGDLIIRGDKKSIDNAKGFLSKLSEIAPVCYVPGNHETKMEEYLEYKEEFQNYWKDITDNGIQTLRNTSAEYNINENKLRIHGLELGMEYYKKPWSKPLELSEIENRISHQKNCYEILMVHSPKYGEVYLKWGADLTLSGHYHGGMLRLSRNRGLISPQFQLFPPFCCGKFSKNEKHLIVSAGMGEHSMPVRIQNPRVVVEIDILPLENPLDFQ